MGRTVGPTVAQVWVQLSHENGVVQCLPNSTLLGSMLTDATFAYTSEVWNVGVFEATRLKSMASRSLSMARHRAKFYENLPMFP